MSRMNAEQVVRGDTDGPSGDRAGSGSRDHETAGWDERGNSRWDEERN